MGYLEEMSQQGYSLDDVDDWHRGLVKLLGMTFCLLVSRSGV